MYVCMYVCLHIHTQPSFWGIAICPPSPGFMQFLSAICLGSSSDVCKNVLFICIVTLSAASTRPSTVSWPYYHHPQPPYCSIDMPLRVACLLTSEGSSFRSFRSSSAGFSCFSSISFECSDWVFPGFSHTRIQKVQRFLNPVDLEKR